MEIEFLKMQGCGDDALLIDCFKQDRPGIEHLPRLADKMLARRRGIGAESLLLLTEGERCRISVRAYSQRGDEVLPSHNALRSAARYASDSGIAVDTRFSMETARGDTAFEIIDSINVRMDMGAPLRTEAASQIKEKPLESYTRTIEVNGKPFTYTPVSLQASFAIAFVTSYDFPLPSRGRQIIGNPGFPEHTGVCFAQVYSREELRLKVWSAGRGTGGDDGLPEAGAPQPRKGAEIPASCPAAAAAVVASVVNGFTDRDVFVHLVGGDVFIQWDEKNNRLYLTGPTTYVFRGTFYFEEEA